MSRLPQEGWKNVRRTIRLSLLGTCLVASARASAGCVSIPPGFEPAQSPITRSADGDLDSTFARAIGLGPSTGTPSTHNPSVDPLAALAHFSSEENLPQRAPLFEVAPPNPFVLSTMGKTQEPVKSIPNLPAVWSGMTGLIGLGTLACARRVKRALR